MKLNPLKRRVTSSLGSSQDLNPFYLRRTTSNYRLKTNFISLFFFRATFFFHKNDLNQQKKLI